ncbi:MAG: bifunctional riboflavin kinase/FAD synthetase [Thermodesulfobacteriota bacterium]|nr:bifunctional riboflavin kinase/FAD synthetase [Thermodesulfobacteriota bacterium]
MSRVISDLKQIKKPLANCVLTVGNFDGVHKGHVALFEMVKKRARSIGGISAVMTFEPHPLKVIRPGEGPPLITLTKQKIQLISDEKVDYIFCIPFTKEFAAISSRDFVKEILVGTIGIKEIIVGYDYTFGHKREGNIELLQKMGVDNGFAVHVVGPQHSDGRLISSTSIRKLVQEGRLEEARNLLGRDYQISGVVVKGKNRGGRLLGFPTANLDLIDELIPARGVYAVRTLIDGQWFEGVTNIGHNPTFGNGVFSVETHVLDFSGDLLGKTISVGFVKYLRKEKTFRTVDELAGQIHKDIEKARRLFSEEYQRGSSASV